MAIELTEKNDGKLLEVRVRGMLTHEDCQRFVPEFERPPSRITSDQQIQSPPNYPRAALHNPHPAGFRARARAYGRYSGPLPL